MEKNKKINIAVIALGFLGDTLLVEPMCRNIKENYPDSHLVFIANKVFEDVPKGFDSVDEIYGFDKKGVHKGVLGYLNFKKKFAKKFIDYAIITHPHERSLILAKTIGAKNVISLPVHKSPLNFFINKKRKYNENELHTMFKADYNNKYVESFCNIVNHSIIYSRKDLDEKMILQKFDLPKNYIVLSPISKDAVKDWSYENVKDFVQKSHLPIVLVGTEKAHVISLKMQEEKLEFVDLSLKTTICELGVIIKNAIACVSVDTGTFHLSYAQDVNTIGLFFDEKMIIEWAPSKLDCVKVLVGKKYIKKGKVICVKDITATDVLNCLNTCCITCK